MKDAFKKFDLTGKAAVVTGGGTGLGYYMARGLARSGARVMITARREQVLKDAAANISKESDGAQVLYHLVDLADRNSVQKLAQHAIETLGGVDIYIGNAATLHFEHLESIQDESMETMFQVNVAANVALVRAFVPGMRERKWGRVLFSSSAACEKISAFEGTGIYSAVKSALNAFTRVGAAEAGGDGVTFNSLILGFHMSDLNREAMEGLEKQKPGAGKALMQEVASMTALGRAGELPEIEGTIQYLASDAASYVTGASIPVDGGLTIMMRPKPVPEKPVYPKNL